jgi:hypothetical protein
MWPRDENRIPVLSGRAHAPRGHLASTSGDIFRPGRPGEIHLPVKLFFISTA